MTQTHRNLRKAAVLVASLDPERSRAILDQMPPAQAQAVERAVEALGNVDDDERRQVIEEFFRLGPLVPAREPSGIELDDPRCKLLVSAALSAPWNSSGETPATQLLHEVPADTVAGLLAREQPQVIAVLLSHLPAQRAAAVLAALGPEVQIEVARRLVSLEETDPMVLDEIEQQLEAWLREQWCVERRRTAGLAALHDILGSAAPHTRDHILKSLGHASPASPHAPQPLPAWSAADVEALDDQDLATVLRQTPGEVLVLALAAAREPFVERALALFAPAKSSLLRQALAQLGPTRLSDIERAQDQLAAVAAHMEQCGWIARSPVRHLSVAV